MFGLMVYLMLILSMIPKTDGEADATPLGQRSS